MPTDEELGVLITAPDGTIYNISLSNLDAFKVPQDKIDSVILSAESAGLLSTEQPVPTNEIPIEESPPAEPVRNTTINIFTSSSEPRVSVTDDSMASTATPRVSSTMSKYAAGSTMSKYAAGSTMSKYAAGSTLGVARDPIPIATFYGKWVDKKQ